MTIRIAGFTKLPRRSFNTQTLTTVTPETRFIKPRSSYFPVNSLKFLDLSLKDLSNTIFQSNTTFLEVWAIQTQLTGSTLEDAIIQECEFDGANLSRVYAPDSQVVGTSFTCCDLHYADFSDTRFEICDMTSITAPGIVLRGATFKHVILDNADLRYADLRDCDFRHASLEHVNLTGAKLKGAKFPKNFRLTTRGSSLAQNL
ncbi:MAG: kctd9 [Bacillota bacterium]|nr:MAG: kctd9 [Bacillota bacterium]